MNQKLKKKLILIIILGIIFVLTVLNLHKIKFAFSMLNLYNQEKNTQSVTNNPEDMKPTIVDNPLQSIIESEDAVGNLPGSVDTKKPFVAIAKEYNNKFENLSNTFQDQLDGLIAQGMEEYSKGDISSAKLATKYLSEGSKLEKTIDSEFESVVRDMEKELKSNNQDTSIIKEIRNYYSSFKNSKKQDIISTGMKYVK